MKTESLLSQKSSLKPSSTADAEIFNLHRLLLPQKPLTKTRSLGPKNHPRSPVLRLKLTSSAHIDYTWQRNRWRKLGPSDPKNHPRSPVLRLTLTSSSQIKYSWQTNRWWKLSPCCPKNHPRNPVLPLTLTLKSSTQIDYFKKENSCRKLSPSVPKIILETQFYRWRWNHQSTHTTAASETVDEN
jgi:hypothetical protein